MVLHAYGVQSIGFCPAFVDSSLTQRWCLRGEMKREREVYQRNWTPYTVEQKRCELDWLCRYKAHTACLLYNQRWDDVSLINVFVRQETCRYVLVFSRSVRCSWRALWWVLSICRRCCETESARVSPLVCAEPPSHTHMLAETFWAEHFTGIHCSLTFCLIQSSVAHLSTRLRALITTSSVRTCQSPVWYSGGIHTPTFPLLG